MESILAHHAVGARVCAHPNAIPVTTLPAVDAKLQVSILSAGNLETVNPFVLLSIECKNGVYEYKTRIQENVTTPEWNETIDISEEDLLPYGKPISIRMSVHDGAHTLLLKPHDFNLGDYEYPFPDASIKYRVRDVQLSRGESMLKFGYTYFVDDTRSFCPRGCTYDTFTKMGRRHDPGGMRASTSGEPQGEWVICTRTWCLLCQTSIKSTRDMQLHAASYLLLFLIDYAKYDSRRNICETNHSINIISTNFLIIRMHPSILLSVSCCHLLNIDIIILIQYLFYFNFIL